MKHLIYSLLICAMCAMMLSSCNTRQAAINNLRNFNTELQVEADYYDLHDWKKAAKRYAKINKRLLKHSYDQEEMAEIGRLQGQCANSFKNAVSNKIEGAASFLEGLLNGIISE